MAVLFFVDGKIRGLISVRTSKCRKSERDLSTLVREATGKIERLSSSGIITIKFLCLDSRIRQH